MIYEYDEESDALFIFFVKEIEEGKLYIENEIWPEELKNHIGLLFDPKNNLIGLEVLFASGYFKEEQLKGWKV